MTLRNAVASELPFLRRYARTLTGSQSVGDAAVRETLEALIEAPQEFDDSVSPRAALYRVFHQIWGGSALRPIEMPGAIVGILPSQWRQALLLTTIEGFSTADAAYILGVSEDELAENVASARESVHAMLSATVLIIEDESIIAMHLKTIMGSMEHQVVGVVRTRGEAVVAASELRPELILADISLADGSSGIDAVRDILAEQSVPVIFITAFPERLLTGERPEPTYLITKPFEPETVAATVWQALLVHRESAALSEQAA